MRKIFLFSTVLCLLALWLMACGDSKKPPVVQPQLSSFAFMQESSTDPGLFIPVLGKFTTTGSNTQFTATTVKDPSTNQVVAGSFGSIFLSQAGDKAVFDLYGGTSDVPSNQWDIFVAKADGTGMAQVTNDTYEDFTPQFSADGKKVIFTSMRPGQLGYNEMQIVVRNVDGTGETVLPTPLGAHDLSAPTFSPDGTKIAVEAWGSNETDGWFDGIVLMNSDGSNPKLISNPYALCECWDERPSFTPGGKIVYTHDVNTETEDTEDIYIMNADGTGAAKISDSIGFHLDPLAFHIVGGADKVLFSSNGDMLTAAGSTGYEIYSMNLDGSGVTRLTSNSVYDAFDGEWFEHYTIASQRMQRDHGKHFQARHAVKQVSGIVKW